MNLNLKVLKVSVTDDDTLRTTKVSLFIDPDVYNSFLTLSKSDLGAFHVCKRKDNGSQQLKYQLRESWTNQYGVHQSGKIISFLPLLGIKPNSKRRGDYVWNEITKTAFPNDKRHTAPVSFSKWLDNIGKPNELVESIKSVQLIQLIQPVQTKLEWYLAQGLTRQESIQLIKEDCPH